MCEIPKELKGGIDLLGVTKAAQSLGKALAPAAAAASPPSAGIPTLSSAQVQEASAKAKSDLRRRSGLRRGGTLATSPLGVTGPAPVKRPTLLSGR